MTKTKLTRGYTLIELIVAVGLFALVMMLASGAYLLMISLNRQTQGIATGINNLSFALETMTRTIRTGTNYGCPIAGTNCSGGTSFSVTDTNNASVSYSLAGSPPNQYIQRTIGGVSSTLTDQSVSISSLTFYVSGTAPASSGEYTQPHVTIIVSGTVSSPGKAPQYFNVETGATMRGTDL